MTDGSTGIKKIKKPLSLEEKTCLVAHSHYEKQQNHLLLTKKLNKTRHKTSQDTKYISLCGGQTVKFLCGLICIHTCYILSGGHVIGQRFDLFLQQSVTLFLLIYYLLCCCLLLHLSITTFSLTPPWWTLFMFFHPTLVLSRTVNTCFLWRHFWRRSYRRVRADVGLFCTVNTTKAKTLLIHSLTDWKTQKTQCSVLYFLPFVSLMWSQFLSLKKFD